MTSMTLQPGANQVGAASRAIVPDLMKAAAIIGVVYIHASTVVPVNAAIVELCRAFRCCVPVFIVVWAFFQERSYLRGQSWRSVVPAKLLAVLLPFVVWTLLYSFVAGASPRGGVLQYISRYWSGYGWSGQYFFIILIQLIVLFPIIRRPSFSLATVTGITVAFAVAFYLGNIVSVPVVLVKISYRPFFFWLPYVVLGIFMARNRDWSLPWYAGVVGALLIVVEAFLPEGAGFDTDYVRPGLLIGTTLLAASALNRPAAPERPFSVPVRCIWLLGGSTMGIFVINPLLVGLATDPISQAGWNEHGIGTPGAVALSLVLAAAVLAAGLGCTLALKRAGLGRIVG